MKIAILLTGQPRTYKLASQIHLKLFQSYDVDYFCSIDLNNTLQHEYHNSRHESQKNDVDNICRIYKPKDVYYSSNYDKYEHHIEKKLNTQIVSYNVDNNDPIPYIKPTYNACLTSGHSPYTVTKNQTIGLMNNCKVIFEQYYFVKKGYNLIFEYVKKTGISYDLIIRLRFDQYLFDDNTHKIFGNYLKYNDENIQIIKDISLDHTLDLNFDLKDNEIVIFGQGLIASSYLYANDQFWITNYQTAKIMSNFYKDLLPIINVSAQTHFPHNGGWIEHFFCLFLLNNKMKIKTNSNQIMGIFIRELA
jgi:hypothetical protein